VDDILGAPVRHVPTRRRGEELALVLEALGVPYRLERSGREWVLVVSEDDLARAVGALDSYEREPPRKRYLPPAAPLTMLGIHVGVVLAAFAVVTGPRMAGSAWFVAGSARARALLHGEPWRAVTALTLHADATHLLGNVALGAVVLGALGGVWGWGIATAATIGAGAIGNVLNAWLRDAPHDAVGASTAIFGAIGVLAGTGFVQRSRAVFGRPWVTVAAALGLLGMLGAGEGTDVLAHLFGLAVGLVMGVVAAVGMPTAPGSRAQIVAAGGSIALLVGSWVAAFAR